MIGILALVVALAAAVGIALLWRQQNQLARRMEAALRTSTGEPLEHTLAQAHQHITAVNRRLAELEKIYADLTVTTSVASQKISLVRYNPFGDTGGDQSFSLAVLDGNNSGYVLTSIHGRQGTRVYIKPIDFGKSKHSLSDEETQAISQAMTRVPALPSSEGDKS